MIWITLIFSILILLILTCCSVLDKPCDDDTISNLYLTISIPFFVCYENHKHWLRKLLKENVHAKSDYAYNRHITVKCMSPNKGHRCVSTEFLRFIQIPHHHLMSDSAWPVNKTILTTGDSKGMLLTQYFRHEENLSFVLHVTSMGSYTTATFVVTTQQKMSSNCLRL